MESDAAKRWPSLRDGLQTARGGLCPSSSSSQARQKLNGRVSYLTHEPSRFLRLIYRERVLCCNLGLVRELLVASLTARVYIAAGSLDIKTHKMTLGLLEKKND